MQSYSFGEGGKKKKKKKKRTTKKPEDSITTPPPSSPAPSIRSPTPITPSKAKTAARPTSPSPAGSSGAFGASTISLAQPITAQSAHAYLAAQDEAKVKVKTRADPSQPQEPKKRGFFASFTKKEKGKNKKKGDENDEESEDEDNAQGERSNIKPAFNQLPARAKGLLSRLLGDGKNDERQGKAGMRWDHFAKV